MHPGYVDDPRNTDCAWMETTAFLFHDDTGEDVGKLPLQAGDDAKALKVMDPPGCIFREYQLQRPSRIRLLHFSGLTFQAKSCSLRVTKISLKKLL